MQESEADFGDLPSHDAYFRSIFSDVEEASKLFALLLPSELSTALELSRLQRIEDTFPGNRAGEIRADLVFVCPIVGTEDSAEIVVVVEHKSNRDNRSKEQILHEWLHLRETRKRIPLIPILFYHGIRPWNPTTFRDEARNLPESIANVQPSVPIIFIDLCRHDDEILKNPQIGGIARLALYLLKNVRTESLHLGTLIHYVEEAAKSPKRTHLEESMIYLERGSLPPESLDQLENAFQREHPMRFKTTYEQRLDQKFSQGIEQGIEKGFQRGLDLEKIDVIRGMLAKKFDWETIESITHIDEARYTTLLEKYK